MKISVVLLILYTGCVHTATIPPGFCTPNDIVLVVDGSNSVGTENYAKLKSQMIEFVRQLPVTQDGIRVGVILYSTRVDPNYRISMTGDETSLVTSILNLPYPGQGTLTNLGIDNGVQMLQTQGRPGVGKKLVVITDGYSNLPADTNVSAVAAKSTGIDTYALGVGPAVYDPELEVIASVPQNVAKATDFNVVFDALRLFSRAMCDDFTTVAPTTIAPPLPSNCAADVVFIIDSSGISGLGNLYTEILNRIKTFIGQQSVSNSGVRVGVVITSDQQTIQIPLSGDPTSLTNQINSNQIAPGGGFLLSQGLAGAISVFNGDSLNRNAPRVAVVIATTGSNGGASSTTEINTLKNLPGGDPMTIVTIGVDTQFGGLYNNAELTNAASSPADVYLSQTINTLGQRLNNIASSECQIPVPTLAPVPTTGPGCAADMVFIADSSDLSTFGNTYSQIVSQIRDFISSQTLSDDGLRIGVVFTNDAQSVKIPLSSDKNQLMTQVDSYVNNPLNGDLLLAQGVSGAIEVFNTDALNRNAPMVAVVLSVTRSLNGAIPVSEANALKALSGGPSMSVYSFGVISPLNSPLYNVNELSTLASRPENLYQMVQPSTLRQTFATIASTECGSLVAPTLPPPTLPADCAADVVFVIDSSDLSTFGDVYTDTWTALNAFVNEQSLSNTGLRVGVVFTSGTSTIPIPLTADKALLQNQLSGFSSPFGGQTTLGNGLDAAAGIFTSDTLNRNAPRVTIVINSGRSNTGPPINEANNLKNLPGAPMKVYSIGVDLPFGQFFDTTEMSTIATGENFISLSDAKAMKETFNVIATSECEPYVPPTPTPPPECAADIVFVIDSSDLSTFGDVYTDTMAALNSFIDQQTLSNTHLRVGAVFTSGTSTIPIPLTADKATLKNQLSGFASPFGGATTLGNGLTAAAGIFASDTMNRNAPRVTIVVNSGRSNTGIPLTEANALKNLPGASMAVYSLGVELPFGAFFDVNEMTAIATSGDFITLPDAKSIQQTFSVIASSECSAIVPPTLPPPADCAADIVFVIDSSDLSTFGNVYTDTMAALNSFVSQQTLSNTNLRIGVVFTSGTSTIPIPLTGDKALLQGQLSGFSTSIGGPTSLGEGLNAAASIFSSDTLNRNAPRVTIVLTSGQTNTGPPLTEASNLKNLPGPPMTVYSVGVNLPFGSFYSQPELEAISTGSENVINLPNTTAIQQTFDSIASTECSSLVATQPPATTTANPAPNYNCAADIVFIVDASDVTKADNIWNDFLDTLRNFVNQPIISDSATRVGIVFTNATTTIDIPLSGNSATIINQLNLNNQQLGGGQLLGTGLNSATSMLVNDPYNRNAPKVAILLTAGRSQGGGIPLTESLNLKTLNGAGTVSTYAVGVETSNGPFYNPDELNAIASTPNQSLQVTDRDTLVSIFNSINAAECRVAEIPANCNPTDIVLIVDGSASIGSVAFQELRSTLLQFAQDIPASPNGINIGVVTYSSLVNPINNIPLTGDLNTLQNEILALPYPEAGTRTDLGIEEGRRVLNFGGRPGVKKVMVVITDGFSDIPSATSVQAQLARDNDNIDMYALGVGNGVDDVELLSIAGYIGNVEKVDNFKSIIPSFLQLSRALCFVPTTPPPSPPPTTPGPSCAADMVIVVDSSDITKSGNIYNDIIETLKNFINQQVVSNTGNRIGIVLTNDGVPTKIPISGDPNYLLDQLNNNPDPLGGGLILGNGLNGAVDLFNNNGISRNVPRVTVVLTAGATRGGLLPFLESNTLKGLQGGDPMTVYAAGIRSPNGELYNPTELQMIASNGKVRNSASTSDILSYLTNVQAAECEIVPDLKSCNPRDIVIVVDGSQSIGPESFALLKQKLIDFTQQIPISAVEANVGLVLYSTTVDATGIIPLTADRVALEAAINALPYPEQGTNTHLGIAAGNDVLKASVRSGVDKVMVVITDGYSDDPTSTSNAANVIQAEGVNVYSIGVGNGVFDAELYNIASSPGNVQKVSTFDAITVPFARVARALCETPCPVDVVFVVDSSDVTNGGQIYERFLETIKSFVRQQSISNVGTRVGIVFANENAGETVQVPLSGDSNYIMNQLDANSLPLGKGLNLGNGLNAATNIFQTNTLNRNAHRLAFVLTAGRSKGGFVPTAEALNLKNLPVTVSAFGLPTPSGILYSMTELRNIATSPFGGVYQQNDFASLPIIFDSLVDDACLGGPPPPIVTPTPTIPIPVCNPRDIVLIVDGSASIGPNNFDVLKSNLVQFVQGLPITPNDANVGVVLYSSDVNPTGQIPLTGNSNSLETAIANLPYPEGGTRTDLGIDSGLAALQNGRPGEDKIMIVITDGYSDLPDATKIAAENAKAAGVTVYAVGIGGIAPTELNDIATGPSYVEQTTDFNSVLQSLLLFSRSLCDPPTTTPAPDCENPLDVVFLLDGSGSVRANNFTIMKEKLANAMPNFNVAPGIVNVGVVVYSDKVYDVVDISDDSNQLQTDILGLSYPQSVTYTNLGIDKSQDMLATQGRPGVPKKLVVITDGESTDQAATQASAAAAKTAGTDIHVIGVGSGYNRQELDGMASDLSQVTIADTFDIISITLEDLVDDICN